MQQRTAWALVRRQHGVIAHAQLVSLGFGDEAIRHRVRTGRLHRVHRGVYVAGRPELSELGSFMAAVLSAGEGAALSHDSAAALWRIVPARPGPIHVSTPRSRRGHEGVVIHRRRGVRTTHRHDIPLTTPTETLIDLAGGGLKRDALEQAIKEADVLRLCTPAQIRRALDATSPRPGVGALKALLDRATFVLTQTQLERLLPPIARRAGLPELLTQRYVNGHRVDFHCPELGLVIEADGGTFHRTPMQQTNDRRRDQAHLAAGLTPLRFTHAQIRYEPEHVEAVLRAVAARLSRAAVAA